MTEHPSGNHDLSSSLAQELLTVVTALWFDIDHHQGRGVSRYFTPNGQLRFSARSFRGQAEIDQVYATRANRGPRVSRHLAANLHVVDTGPDHATAVSVLLLFAEDGDAPRPLTTPALVADVTDEFVLDHGRWFIASRSIDHTFIAPDTALAVPTS